MNKTQNFLVFAIALLLALSGCGDSAPADTPADTGDYSLPDASGGAGDAQVQTPPSFEQSSDVPEGTGVDSTDLPNLPDSAETAEETAENTVAEPLEEADSQTVPLFEPVLKYPGAYNGPLYATSEQIGNYQDKAKYMGNLKRNGVNFFIGMFAIFGKTTPETFVDVANLGYVADLAVKYPGMVVPFFGSGLGGEELEPIVKAKDGVWIGLYKDVFDTYADLVGDDFIRGVGEVETQEWSLQHNDPKIMQLVELVDGKGKSFMFHPVADKLDGVEDMIDRYPNTMFLIHMYREDVRNGRTKLISMMKSHDNLFFSIDAAHILHYDGNDILYSYHDDYGQNAQKKFISTVNANYNSIIDSAVRDYKPLVAAVPDKVMWGTEAGPAYSFEPETYDLMVKASRDFIAKVADDKEVQKALGYKNALRVFGTGVALDESRAPADTSSWELCDDAVFDTCAAECGIDGESDDEEIGVEAEGCEVSCFMKKQCIDPLDED